MSPFSNFPSTEPPSRCHLLLTGCTSPAVLAVCSVTLDLSSLLWKSWHTYCQQSWIKTVLISVRIIFLKENKNLARHFTKIYEWTITRKAAQHHFPYGKYILKWLKWLKEKRLRIPNVEEDVEDVEHLDSRVLLVGI